MTAFKNNDLKSFEKPIFKNLLVWNTEVSALQRQICCIGQVCLIFSRRWKRGRGMKKSNYVNYANSSSD